MLKDLVRLTRSSGWDWMMFTGTSHTNFTILKLFSWLPFRLTKDNPSSLRVEMTDTDGNFKRADYSTFKLLNDITYNIKLDGFSSGDNWQVRDSLRSADTMAFSAPSRDNDASPLNCASKFGSGNW